jgi:predicted HTH transcriptional regulator
MKSNKIIYDLIAQGEHQKQDFKFEISDARKISKTLVAFSNCLGGRLLIGVKDNGRIAGIRSEEEFYMLETAALLYCKPEINFSIERIGIEGKTILIAKIEEGKEKPYYSLNESEKWLAYIRVADENFLANPVQLQVWKNANTPKGIFFKYTDKEELLLKFLEERGSISLNYTSRLLKMNRWSATKLLAKLVSMDILEIEFSEKQSLYKLKLE